ncbi:hypothetical protein J2B92_17120 [Lysinibacillus sphaericus]|uniref:hypothetical protein n=1 Tax=Lysinibacillus sphaericus TaxID=1421 RepID=UPI0018CF653C|nr:hypothetical protein [Lysinibacillus sphaericus]MBG9756406.1 hypothetical protein [Lysinibacillus sphaericus]QTB12562.1 hypothetical protein J2B92_17120 [Lysinibacillus sphaericus]
MKTLIIYDTDGVIISLSSSTQELRQPKGIPFMVIDTPQNKQVVGVDVSDMPHKPILIDTPKSAEQEQIDALTQAVAELSLLVGGGA